MTIKFQFDEKYKYKSRADHDGQPLKFALNPAVLLGKIAKFIVFVPIFLYNMITVKKLLS